MWELSNHLCTHGRRFSERLPLRLLATKLVSGGPEHMWPLGVKLHLGIPTLLQGGPENTSALVLGQVRALCYEEDDFLSHSWVELTWEMWAHRYHDHLFWNWDASCTSNSPQLHLLPLFHARRPHLTKKAQHDWNVCLQHRWLSPNGASCALFSF